MHCCTHRRNQHAVKENIAICESADAVRVSVCLNLYIESLKLLGIVDEGVSPPCGATASLVTGRGLGKCFGGHLLLVHLSS